jgi:hypothetical protein
MLPRSASPEPEHLKGLLTVAATSDENRAVRDIAIEISEKGRDEDDWIVVVAGWEERGDRDCMNRETAGGS